MASPPPAKRRKLPPLDDSFAAAPARPSDKPELHQGRKRTREHTPGQWPCHVFIELPVDSELQKSLRRAIKICRSIFPSSCAVHSLWELDPPAAAANRGGEGSNAQQPGSEAALLEDGYQEDDGVLHLSLSRPVYVRPNQRDELLRLLRAALTSPPTPTIELSFAEFRAFSNDDRSRCFLALEAGAGYDAMRALLKRVDGVMERMRLPTYYDDPDFHASFAWCLPLAATSSEQKGEGQEELESSAGIKSVDSNPFEGVLAKLNEQLGRTIAKETWDVNSATLRIGKASHAIPFS